MTLLSSGMGWAIFGAAFIFIFILLGILAENQRQQRKLARQELLQKERFMAMEKGLPLPEWDVAMLDEQAVNVSNAESFNRNTQRFRFVSLCIGLLMVFSGIGMALAFQLSSDRGFKELSTIGIIPMMAGVGLLLFYVLTRSYKS